MQQTSEWICQICLKIFAGYPINMKQIWRLRSQKQSYQMYYNSQMLFSPLTPWPPNRLEMELDQMYIPRHYWIFRNHGVDGLVATNVLDSGQLMALAWPGLAWLWRSNVMAEHSNEYFISGRRGRAKWENTQVVICGSALLRNGNWAQECNRSNCTCSIWTERANVHVTNQKYKSKQKLLNVCYKCPSPFLHHSTNIISFCSHLLATFPLKLCTLMQLTSTMQPETVGGALVWLCLPAWVLCMEQHHLWSWSVWPQAEFQP